MSLRLSAYPGSFGHVGESSVAVVVEEIVPLAVRMAGVQQVGLDEDVEEPVAVVVAEGRHHGRVLYRESPGLGLLPERAVTLVDVEEVRGAEAADINVEEPVVVDVRKCCAMLPYCRRFSPVGDPCPFRHVLKPPIPEIAEQPATPGLAHDKDVGAAVAV